MMNAYDNYYIKVRKSHKGAIISRRKDFMELLIKALGDNEQATKDLDSKFGTTLVAKTTVGSDTSIIVDGERSYKGS